MKKSQALKCESTVTSWAFQKNPSGKGVISRNKTRWNRLRNVPKICQAKTAQAAPVSEKQSSATAAVKFYETEINRKSIDTKQKHRKT